MLCRLFFRCLVATTILISTIFFSFLATETLLAAEHARASDLFRAENLAAWCIVPFDDQNRSPTDRIAMLNRLGIKKYAYDYRAEHIPHFDEEMEAIKAGGIDLVGWWFPTSLNDEATLILDVLKRHDIQTCLWVTGGGEPVSSPEEQKRRVASEADRIRPIALAAKTIGCTVGLYNHGGWFGEPENQIDIIQLLGLENVGIIYNQHHGHRHIGRWKELLNTMKPHLMMLNVNGMFADGETSGRKIVPLGQGDLDLELLRTVVESGYRGPCGILNHTQLNAEDRLRDNLAGLGWLTAQLDGKDATPKPFMKTWQVSNPAENPLTVAASPQAEGPFDPAVIAALAAEVREHGNAGRGVELFSKATLACMSCHKLGEHGGNVGPPLSNLGKDQTLEQIIESLLWPQHVVKPEFQSIAIITENGNAFRGYRQREDDRAIWLRDATSGTIDEIPKTSIESTFDVGSLMPDGLLKTLSPTNRRDLIRLLTDLGRHEEISAEQIDSLLKQAHAGVPVAFAFQRDPLEPANWPSWKLPVNRDRIYDYYSKQARFFRGVCPAPVLLPEFPGLDGGTLGHWGNQNEESWKSNHWNKTVLGSVQCGVLRGFGKTVPRAVCVQLGEGYSACFDPSTLTYPVVWSGGFVKFSDIRHGFMDGLSVVGTPIERASDLPATVPFHYEGFCRNGTQVGFLYSINGQRLLNVPVMKDGVFSPICGPVEGHPYAHFLRGSAPQWPQIIQTQGVCGTGIPYAVDTLTLPHTNPWNAPLYCGDHDFLSDGALVVCTMQGDVWRVDGIDSSLNNLTWRRIASGLHQTLGLVVVEDVIHLLGRDQITRLHDKNADGEIDFYECFSNVFDASAGGHDYMCGLVRDDEGRFYTSSGSQGLLRISADGSSVELLATGLRNSDGVGIMPDGTITAANSEGDWVPSSMVCAVRRDPARTSPLHFGHKGPKDSKAPDLPLVYLPRGMDNSSGGQVWCSSDSFGPLKDHLLHLSFGAGTAFMILQDEVDSQLQGAVVPLPVEFRSGSHRGRFGPRDGQLYVSGMAGWGSYTPDVGCLHRVRCTGKSIQMPIGFHVHENGVVLSFSETLDPESAKDSSHHFAQCWNYRYSGGYGSSEYSARHDGMRGHDHLTIASVHLLEDGRSMFLEIPTIQPVNQLHLHVQSSPDTLHDLILTVHRLDQPFTSFEGYSPRTTPISKHPLLVDVSRSLRKDRNPFEKPILGARAIEITVGSNLSFVPRRIEASPGESISVTLINPDVVPHNWALLKPGSLARAGAQVNKLVTDPDAAGRQYIPASDDVLAYTDIVDPHSRFTIHFKLPETAGRYPFFCTFPGHWMVMNGELIVE